jgi:predicted ATP-binding protein involved in virulence
MTTAGNRGMPLPIQTVSQGTMSMLAIFGQIYRFLRSIRPNGKEEDIQGTPAIVFIDELDAHLHPSWQQKVVALLTGEFPNVQFIFSAHSPLMVAGCDEGEVSVLRRREDGDRFYVETLNYDFLGATSQELCDRIFEIEEVDRLYLEYSTKAAAQNHEKRLTDIRKLAQQQQRTRKEDEQLAWLLRENRLIERAEAVRKEKLEAEESQALIDDLKRQIERLQYQLEQAREKKTEGNIDGGLPR